GSSPPPPRCSTFAAGGAPMDILHEFPIAVPIKKVFDGVSLPSGLDTWWTKQSSGKPALGNRYQLDFGPGFHWAGRVVAVEAPLRTGYEITDADADWKGTRVGLELATQGAGTLVRFAHRGWKEANAHYRVSSFCWAMYLRLLRLHLETGLFVEYDQRLAV